MGVNLFVEGSPLPVVVRIRLARELTNLKDLKEVIEAINAVDNFFKKDWPIFWSSSKDRIRRSETKLISFRVDSPPEVQLFTDPAWIAVFITVLSNYKGIKENLEEIKKDIEKIGFVMRGFSERELQLLDIAVRLTLDRILESGEEKAERFAKLCSKIRHHLLSSDKDTAEISVKKINGDWQG